MDRQNSIVTKSNRIHVGCRVQGPYGPLLPNPNGNKRRVRFRSYGTVLRAIDQQKWEVMYDFDGARKPASSKQLTIVPHDTGVPAHELSVVLEPTTDPSNYDDVVESEDMEEADIVTDELVAAEDETDEAAADEANTNSTPNNDFCFTQEDFLEAQSGHNDATRHRSRIQEVWNEIKKLEGEEITVESAKDGKIVWKVVTAVTSDEMTPIIKREEEFSKIHTTHFQGDVSSYPSLQDAFWSFWCEDMDREIERLTVIVVNENIERKRRFQRSIKIVTKAEFMIFHALIIGAAMHPMTGTTLWKKKHFGKKNKVRKSLSPEIDFSIYMMEWRFKEIKSLIPRLMEDQSLKDSDDWWRFKGRIKSFNKKSKDLFAASSVMVFDESMSAFIL